MHFTQKGYSVSALPGQTAMLDGFEVEYRLAPHMVVFSHGFAVRRDSRGMFTDLAASLPETAGYVLFDYDGTEGDMVRATYVADQIARLRRVVDWVRQQPGVKTISMIAHSRGCLIAALAKIHPLHCAIMLAPPLVQGHARQYFTHKLGSIRKDDDWYVPRSDGTTTIISEGVFEEFDQVQREAVLLEYADVQPMLVIAAGADGVLGDQDLSGLGQARNIQLETIAGASHDFEGAARQQLINLINTYLKERL